jgi:hypothetical protein
VKKSRTTALSLFTAGALAVGIALAGPAAGSTAYCTAGAPSPDTIYGKDLKYKLAYTRADMTCRSGVVVGPDWQRAPYLPEVIVGMYFEAILQSQNPDGSWTNRASGSAAGDQEGRISIDLSTRCIFVTPTNWRVTFVNANASVYSGRDIHLSDYSGRVSTLACG